MNTELRNKLFNKIKNVFENEDTQEKEAFLQARENVDYAYPKAFELASRVADLFPKGLDHVFFTNSGSESVDTSLKIALAYQKAIGQGSRQRLVGREKGYHGMGFGGVSVGGLVKNRAAFGMLLPGTDHIRHTLDIERNAFSKGLPAHGAELADDLQKTSVIRGLHSVTTIRPQPANQGRPISLSAADFRRFSASRSPRTDRAEVSANDGVQPSSMRRKRSTSSAKLMSDVRSSSTFFTACITVVWSRPPNFRPISGRDRDVNCFAKYMATCRGLATERARRAECISEIRILKCSATRF